MRLVQIIVTGRRRLRYAGKRKYGWKLVVNGEAVATDGRQDFNNASDAEDIASRIANGEFSDYRIVRREVA